MVDQLVYLYSYFRSPVEYMVRDLDRPSTKMVDMSICSRYCNHINILIYHEAIKGCDGESYITTWYLMILMVVAGYGFGVYSCS